MASASFLLNGSIPSGANLLTAGSTATLALADIAGASNTTWSFIGSSEDVVLPTITLTGKGTASFVVPSAPSHGLGLSLMLQCVNAGQTARALICVGTVLMVAANEIDERSALGGWAWQWNENLRTAMLTRDGKAYISALSGNATWALTGVADFVDFKHLTISSLGGANRTLTLGTSGAVLNDSLVLVFPGESSGYSLTLSNGSTTLATLGAYRNTTVKLWFNGTAWVVTSVEASALARRAFTTTLSGATAWYTSGAAGVTGCNDLTVSSLGGADRTLTLWETRVVEGDKATLTYLGSDEGYALTLAAGAGGTLATLPAWQNTRVELYYTGTAWAVLSTYALGGGVIKAYNGTLSGATAWYLSGAGALDGCRSVTISGLGGADRTLTLWETYAVAGDEVTLRYTGTANILTLAAGAGGTLATLLPGRDNEVRLVYTGAAWAVAKQRQALVLKSFAGAITADGTWSLAGSGTYAGCTTVVATSLNANRTLTLDTIGALAGDLVTAINVDTSYNLIISGVVTLYANQFECATLRYSGSAWELISKRKENTNATVTVNEYTAAGTYTWTKPVSAGMVRVLVVGGGGGGASTGGNIYGAASGGSSGQILEWVGLASNVPSSVTVTVGAAGGAVSAGSNSSFGSILVAEGGAAGIYNTGNANGNAGATKLGANGGGGGGAQCQGSGSYTGGAGGGGGGGLSTWDGAAGGNSTASTAGAGGKGGGPTGGAGGNVGVGTSGYRGAGGVGYGAGGGGGCSGLNSTQGNGGGGGGGGYDNGTGSPVATGGGQTTTGGGGTVGYVMVMCW